MQTETHVEFEGGKLMKLMHNTRHRVIAAASILSIAIAGSVAASDPQKGIVDLTTNYGASGTIASVAGISGVSGSPDTIEVKFKQPMHPGNFGMGVNFAKAWTKSWNPENTVLTIGGDIDFSQAADPALIVYLMQTEADRKDISEPNIFKFRDIKVTGVETGNGQANVDFENAPANGKGFGVYLGKSQDGPFKPYGNVNFNSKGVHIKGLSNGQTYWVYLEHLYYQQNGQVVTRTAPIAITPQHPSGK